MNFEYFKPNSKKTIEDFIQRNNIYNALVKISDCSFFGMDCGIEHYKLLCYLSHCFDDCDIFDIGTSSGLSALALSYNKTNTIYSFDITNHIINTPILRRKNIKFILDNLWQPETRLKWEHVLLNSKFIFLDIDPHEGTYEYEFYEYLKSKNYQGFVIFDDIHYFEGMKKNFWEKIPNDEKIDLTKIGHWSGTGMISFNKKYIEVFQEK